ncbi:MAG: hypothetical protein AAFX78_18260 [Cyanobacteria bacterium J06638_20]
MTSDLPETQWAVQVGAVGDRHLSWVPQCKGTPDSHQVSAALVG